MDETKKEDVLQLENASDTLVKSPAKESAMRHRLLILCRTKMQRKPNTTHG